MVAVLLRLRFRVLWNTLSRNTVQLLAVIAGAVSGLVMLMVVVIGMLIASTAAASVTQVAVVVAGSALVLGWLAVPLLFDGVDRTLDPQKLGRFPLPTGQVMLATFIVGVAWVPGVITLLGAVSTALAWRNFPVSMAVAVVTGLIGTATCVVGSRLTTTAAGALLGGRRSARVAIGALGIILLAIPIAAVLVNSAHLGAFDLFANFTTVAAVLAWTPLGAVWAIPGYLAMGDAGAAAGATAIALATLGLLVLLWRLSLAATGRTGPQGRAASAGRLGALGWVPTTATGAVAARSLIYWLRDPRLSRQLILIPVLPAIMLFLWSLVDLDWIPIIAGPTVASLLPLAVFAGLSYDGTAFAAELAAGVRGVHDRLGRAIALLVISFPAAIVVQVAIAIIIGRVSDLPALLGLSIGTLLAAVGVVSVSSAILVVPVARSGRNPYSAQAGSATQSIVASYAVTGVTGALALPAVGLAIASLVTGSPLFGWLALAVALLLGTAEAIGGIMLGGRMLDNSGPSLLARMRLMRT